MYEHIHLFTLRARPHSLTDLRCIDVGLTFALSIPETLYIASTTDMRHADLLSPFTRTSIQRIRDILASTKAPESVSWDPRTQRYLYKGDGDRVAEINARKGIKPGQGDKPREAAVLLPLVNFRRADLPAFKGKGKQRATDEDIIPGILLQVRAGHMRMHAGEVRWDSSFDLIS